MSRSLQEAYRQARLREDAISMFDDGDQRSFNDIYGEEGIPLEGDENIATPDTDDDGSDGSVTVTLTADQVSTLKQILAQLPDDNVATTDTDDGTMPLPASVGAPTQTM